MNPPTRTQGFLVFVALVVLALVALPIALVALLVYVVLRVLLRAAVELLVFLARKPVVLVYSQSPVWQPRIDEVWLPRVGSMALVLDWTSSRPSLLARLLRAWAPPRNVQPVAILFPGPLRTRRLDFYDAFRDWKNGDEAALRRAEEELFAFAEGRR